MKSIIVTPATNVERNEDNEILFDEDDMPVLIDEEQLGMIINTHCINISQFNAEKQQLETGVIFRHEVVWEHKRIPATEFVAPDDLAWVSIEEEESDEDKKGKDDDDDAEDENELESFHEDNTTSEDPDDEGYF